RSDSAPLGRAPAGAARVPPAADGDRRTDRQRDISRVDDEPRPAVAEVEHVRLHPGAVSSGERIAVRVLRGAHRAVVADLGEPAEALRDLELRTDADSNAPAEEYERRG